MEQMSESILLPGRLILLTAIFLLAVRPVAAQEPTDTLRCPCSANMAAFDLPWLAKYYGWDWKTDSIAVAETASSDSYTFALRANLLRWATLTPDIGIEWRITPAVGVLVHGSWTSWTWQDNARRYALWEVAQEVRWYLGEARCWYVGAMLKAGQFNYKFSGTGRQGNLLGGGITGGWQLRLNRALALDFSLGLGYLNADTERYDVIDGVRVRRRHHHNQCHRHGQRRIQFRSHRDGKFIALVYPPKTARWEIST